MIVHTFLLNSTTYHLYTYGHFMNIFNAMTRLLSLFLASTRNANTPTRKANPILNKF